MHNVLYRPICEVKNLALESERHSVRKTVTVRIGLKTLLALFILQNGIKYTSMQIGTHL